MLFFAQIQVEEAPEASEIRVKKVFGHLQPELLQIRQSVVFGIVCPQFDECPRACVHQGVDEGIDKSWPKHNQSKFT